MSESNGAANLDLDLTPYVAEWQRVKVGGLVIEVQASDMPLADAVRAQQAVQKLAGLTKDSALSEAEAADLEATIWDLAERLTQRTRPALERPLRELISLSGAMVLVGFLLSRWGAATTGSTPPWPSPNGTAAPSASGSSSAPPASSRRRAGS
jgi:hypothetical protein